MFLQAKSGNSSKKKGGQVGCGKMARKPGGRG